MDRYKVLLLGLYITGIIIGGGILALPFVAMDAGLPILIFLLVLFGAMFYIMYIRILNSVAYYIKGIAKIRPGLEIFDYALEKSGLAKYGKMMFTVGLALYVIPADIVYMLYGMKSIVALSEILDISADIALIAVGLVSLLFVVVCSAYVVRIKRRYVGPHESFLMKISMMLSIWLIGIGALRFIGSYPAKVAIAVMVFCSSILIGEYFPDRVFRISYDIYDLGDLEPKHKVGSYLTLAKVILILMIPIVAFILIVTTSGIAQGIPIAPRSVQGVVYSTTIIIFMYVGSGVYNILVYRWVSSRMEIGKKAVYIAILLSMATYIIFTLLILSSVDADILVASDLNREHAFIALSRKLTLVGLTELGYATIVAANIFALISVAVAYMGFTETLSERVKIDTGTNASTIWLTITFLLGIATILLEVFDVTRFATDALGIAGNAGGGMFALILPWLLESENSTKNIAMAIIFLIVIVLLNISLMLGGATIVTVISAIISTILIVVFSSLAIIEATKGK